MNISVFYEWRMKKISTPLSECCQSCIYTYMTRCSYQSSDQKIPSCDACQKRLTKNLSSYMMWNLCYIYHILVKNSRLQGRLIKSSDGWRSIACPTRSNLTSNLLNSIWHKTFSHVSLSTLWVLPLSIYGSNVIVDDDISNPTSSYISLIRADSNVSHVSTPPPGICRQSG
jgi:hypothetical protein